MTLNLNQVVGIGPPREVMFRQRLTYGEELQHQVGQVDNTQP